jgi:hypothetical protein
MVEGNSQPQRSFGECWHAMPEIESLMSLTATDVTLTDCVSMWQTSSGRSAVLVVLVGGWRGRAAYTECSSNRCVCGGGGGGIDTLGKCYFHR